MVCSMSWSRREAECCRLNRSRERLHLPATQGYKRTAESGRLALTSWPRAPRPHLMLVVSVYCSAMSSELEAWCRAPWKKTSFNATQST